MPQTLFETYTLQAMEYIAKFVKQALFSSDLYSYKFHGLGMKYKVAVSITCGEIVWVNEYFPWGL